MGHGIIAGLDNVVMVGKKAWHGLGLTLDEQLTPVEGLEACGLDWKWECAR